MIKLKLYNTFWVYILPGMFTFYNMVIFMSFFRSIPESLIESARLDGASEFTVYWKIVMPNAKPVIATIGLFTAVYHWNDYYQGVVYIRDKTLEPLQTILYKLLAETSMTAQQQQAMLALGGTTTSATVKYAAMFVGALPILCLYPFIQKYLVKGVMLGAIKGNQSGWSCLKYETRSANNEKLVSVLLVAIMIFSLAACAKGGGTETTSAAPAQTEAAKTENTEATETTASADAPAWEKDTSPIDMEWFVGASWYGYTWGDSLSTKHITEKTGVNINIVTPTGDVSEELNLMMISGTLPDLISLGSWETCYNTLYEQGYTYALNELADQYDPYFWKVVDGSVVAWHTKSDGNLYCVPNDAYGAEQMAETGMTAAVQTFLVRKDLYEDMGSPDMSTPEGFLNTLRTLKNEYATYKGVDITPFYAQGGSGYGLTSYLQNFLAVPYEEDGKIYDRISNPDYIEWLKTFRQAYQEGLIGIDYLVDSDDQVTEKSNNGAYFCMLREWSGMQEANAILASSENPDSYYIAIDGPANSNGDAPLIFPGSLDGWMSTFISKDCKDPARAIAFLTYMLSEEGQKDIFLGVEGETYEVVDGKPQLTDEMIELMNSDPNTFATQYGLVDTYWMLRNSVIVDQWRPASPYYITAMSDWADKNAFVNGGIYNNLEPTGDSEEAIAATRINQRWQEVVPELITAASDEEFDKILSDFLAARDSYGYEKVVSYEQNLLDVRKALFQ